MSNLSLYYTDPNAYLATEVNALAVHLHELHQALPLLPRVSCAMHMAPAADRITIILRPRTPEHYQQSTDALILSGWSFDGKDHISDISGIHLHDFTHPAYSFRFQVQADPAEVGTIRTAYEAPIVIFRPAPTLGDLADLATIEHYEPDAGDFAD